MNLSTFWNETWAAAVVNHLWQSTVFVAIAWLLAMALRKNHARARYWVWMAASLKFLFPFSLLMTAGEWMRSLVTAPIAAKPALENVMEQIAQPFPQRQLFDTAAPVTAAHHTVILPLLLLPIWACGALIVVARWAREWRCLRAVVRAASPLALVADVPVSSSPTLLEPGIFGIFKPVLLLPEGILDRLTPQQLRAIVAHEMCHVRRRDNLTSAVHMVVEALFWFHPVVWRIGTRLVEERERACDEAVLQAGSEAEVYAEGILNVCKFYVESPLACVSGVTGSDLKKRIMHIMARQTALRLNFSKKLLLSLAGLLAVAVPIAFGLAQLSFEVVSIHPLDPHAVADNGGQFSGFPSNRFTMQRASLNTLIQLAYGTGNITGGPDWIRSEFYSVNGKVEGDALLTQKQMRPLLQNLLEERFHLKIHRVQHLESGYALVVAKGGPKLQPTNGGPFMGMNSGCELKYQNASVESFGAMGLQHGASLGKPVADRTGLDGMYDFDLKFVPDDNPYVENNPTCAHLPDVFTAVQQQLGLKLVPQKVPVDAIIIDHADRPTEN